MALLDELGLLEWLASWRLGVVKGKIALHRWWWSFAQWFMLYGVLLCGIYQEFKSGYRSKKTDNIDNLFWGSQRGSGWARVGNAKSSDGIKFLVSLDSCWHELSVLS